MPNPEFDALAADETAQQQVRIAAIRSEIVVPLLVEIDAAEKLIVKLLAGVDAREEAYQWLLQRATHRRDTK